MAEYIEKEKALNIFGDIPEGYGYYKPFTFPVSRTTREAITLFKKEINKITAADVAPVKHGRWVRKGSNWYCTECNRGYRIICGAPAAVTFEFCPNCGCKMDGDE